MILTACSPKSIYDCPIEVTQAVKHEKNINSICKKNKH